MQDDDKDTVEVVVLEPEEVQLPRKNSLFHERNEKLALQIKTLSGYGLSKASIALGCQTTPYIIDKYYLEEFLKGQADMQRRIAAMAFEAAENGSVPMIMYLAKAKLGWVEGAVGEQVGEVRAVVSNKPLTTEEFKKKYLEEE